MTNMAGNSGETHKENYCGFFGKLCNRKQQHEPREDVQGKVTFNLKAPSEHSHQRPLERNFQDHKRQMHANEFEEGDVYVLE